MNFQQEVAIVTGAGQGIGYAISRELAACGAGVILNDQDAVLAEEAARKIQQAGGRCLAYPGPAEQPDVIDGMLQAAVANFGKLTMAVANAGITLFGSFLEYQPEALRKVMEVNLLGSFFLAQAAARQMKQQGQGGSILLMSSVTGLQAHKNLVPYGMTKAAIQMLAKGLVAELSELGISVNAIAPGATITERTQQEAGYEATWAHITPMGRAGTVEDVAHAALFLVSPQARHITGQTLVIDGGWSATSPSPYAQG